MASQSFLTDLWVYGWHHGHLYQGYRVGGCIPFSRGRITPGTLQARREFGRTHPEAVMFPYLMCETGLEAYQPPIAAIPADRWARLLYLEPG